MRTQLKNTVSALLYELVSVIIGFILPKLMIETFGSDTYGLSSSIVQFLSYATLIEAGIGGVTRAALYKAFAAKDTDKVSGILKATQSFFTKVAAIFLAYIAVLAVVYPRYIDTTFDPLFTGSLIVIIAISSLAQYCFGATYSIFLQADRKNYVSHGIQIVTSILNAVLVIVLINLGASFHMVKLVSASVFVIRPLFLNFYVNRKYQINKKAQPDHAALSQRWNSLTHHIATFLHNNTDVAIITIFGTLSDVSVCAVYYMVAGNLQKLMSSMVSGVEALFGNMMASQGMEKARRSFSFYSMLMNTAVILIFSTAGAMLMPFISLYTSQITDANYYIPLLGYMLLAAEGMYCLRIPYHGIVNAAGHFKQTRVSAILEATINIVLSIVLIKCIGVPGVAIATAIAMFYRTAYYIWYLSRNVLKISLVKNAVRVLAAILLSVALVWLRWQLFPCEAGNYLQWILQACGCGVCIAAVCVVYDLLFYHAEFRQALAGACKKLKKNR